MTRRHRYAAAVVILAALALPSGAGAAEADDPRFGGALWNVPLVIGGANAGPWVGVQNTGDVPVAAVVTVTGGGWGPAETAIPLIEPGDMARVPVTIGEGRAEVRAVITNDETGMDRAQIVLESVARHAEWWEAVPWHIVALGAFLALLAVIYAARRRREAIMNEQGQGLAEYALLIALIALVAIVALAFLGGAVADVLSTVGTSV